MGKGQGGTQDTVGVKDGDGRKRKKGERGGREKIARQPLVSGMKRALQERAAPAATEPGNAAKGRKKRKFTSLGPGNGQPTSPDPTSLCPPNTPRSHPVHGNRWPLGALTGLCVSIPASPFPRSTTSPCLSNTANYYYN